FRTSDESRQALRVGEQLPAIFLDGLEGVTLPVVVEKREERSPVVGSDVDHDRGGDGAGEDPQQTVLHPLQTRNRMIWLHGRLVRRNFEVVPSTSFSWPDDNHLAPGAQEILDATPATRVTAASRESRGRVAR